MSSTAATAVKVLAGRLLVNLEDAQDEVGEELRERLQSLAEASAAYYLEHMAGIASDSDGDILKARAATLQAAGAIKVGEVIQNTLTGLAGAAIGVLFSLTR